MSWFKWGSWFNTPVKQEHTDSEAQALLKQITDILFPPLESCTAADGTKYQVDHSTDMNLDAALYDLEEGHNDIVTQNTVREASNKLFQVRTLLEVEQLLDEDTKYLVVDNVKDGDSTGNIQTREY